MKIYLLILLSSFVPLSANPGDFVKDVIIRDFDVKIPSIKKEIISNNLDLFQMKSDYFPIAEIEIHLYGGESSVGKHSMELPAVLANVLRFGGSKKYPEEKFLHKLEFYGAQMAVEAEYRKIKLQVSFLTKDTDQILELIEDLILNPNLSEISIDNAKKKIAEQIKRRFPQNT
ncbi:MAG: insulinase family protein [Leptospira sp.]|nr:insulinase family protein [Leptospira sp.]